MSFDPYLMFGSTCGEAFTRYQQIFGGELFVMRMGDAPGNEQVPADQADLVIHAALTIDGRVLMGSDDPTGGATGGAERVHVYHQAADIPMAEKVYAALSEGGEQVQPLMETFFSPKWGMCTDRWGIRWMIGVAGPQMG
jgi:PhnB protein